MNSFNLNRTVTKALFGGGAYSYIRVLPDEFLLKSTVMTTDFKRNSSGRTRIYEYPPPPPINALVTAPNLNSRYIYVLFLSPTTISLSVRISLLTES